MKRILLILNAMLLTCLAAAGPGTRALRVFVADSSDKQPLQGAVVMVQPYQLWAMTDSKGQASINNVPTGKCSLEISLLGYVTKTVEATIQPEGTQTFDIKVKLSVQS